MKIKIMPWFIQFFIYAFLLKYFNGAVLASVVVAPLMIASAIKLLPILFSKNYRQVGLLTNVQCYIRNIFFGVIFFSAFIYAAYQMNKSIQSFAENIKIQCDRDNKCPEIPEGFKKNWMVEREQGINIAITNMLAYAIFYETNGKYFQICSGYMPERGNCRNSGVGIKIEKTNRRLQLNDT